MKHLPVDYPVIQAPMQGITSPEMVAAASMSGCLGSLPLGGLLPEKSLELVRRTKALTKKPFAVNLFAHTIPAINREIAEAMSRYLVQIGEKYQMPFTQCPIEQLQFYSYEDQIKIILSENIKIVSFTLGLLNEKTVRMLKSHHVILIGTATCPEEAEILDFSGVDIIVAQGIEAGGHRGTFLNNIPLPQIPLNTLVPQIIQVTSKPIIAAGGLIDKQSIRTALAIGAQGIQAGTAFIASDESLASPSHKAALKQATANDTMLTRSFSGRRARSIRNRFIEKIEQSGLTIPEYPIQNSLTTPLRNAAKQTDNKDFISLYAGMSASKSQQTTTAEICRQLIVSLTDKK